MSKEQATVIAEEATLSITALDSALARAIEGATTGVQAGVDFLATEIPEVVHQLVIWYGVYYTLLFFSAIAGSIVLWKSFRAGIAVLEEATAWQSVLAPGFQKRVDEGEPPKEYMFLRTQRVSDEVWIPFWGVWLLVAISWATFCYHHLLNLTWLKLIIAPKVWLIEYASKLVS